MWVRSWISRREKFGVSHQLCTELRNEDIPSFKNFFRLNPEQFDVLLQKVQPFIQKQWTNMREPLSAKLKLEITLRFLCTGDSFSSLQYLFRVPKTTISRFIPEVCDAIKTVLAEYIEVRIFTGYEVR